MNDTREQPTDEYPPVTWDEACDHLVTRLMMDEEWLVAEPEKLTWWPTPLPMEVTVLNRGEFPDSSENWLQLTGFTAIAEVAEPLGRQLAAENASRYPVGVLRYCEGQLRLQTNYSFNPRNRTLLSWFHNALLIQAATAVHLASEWAEYDGVEIMVRPHPESGERSDVDDLVRIYGSDELNFDVDDAAMERFAAARSALRVEILRDGRWRPGFSNEEVDFYNLGFNHDDAAKALASGGFDIAIGVMPGTDLHRQLGPSIRITGRLLAPGTQFSDEQVTFVNDDMCRLPFASVFGNVTGDEPRDAGSRLWAAIPHLTISEWSRLPQTDFVNSVLNAVWHVNSAAQMFRREFLGIE